MSDDERPADQTDALQRAKTAALPGPELEPLLRAQQLVSAACAASGERLAMDAVAQGDPGDVPGAGAPGRRRGEGPAKEYLARCERERTAVLAAGQPWPPKGRSNTKPRMTASTPSAAPPQVGLRLRISGTGPAKIALTAPVPSTPPTDHPPGLWVRGSRRIL